MSLSKSEQYMAKLLENIKRLKRAENVDWLTA